MYSTSLRKQKDNKPKETNQQTSRKEGKKVKEERKIKKPKKF